MLRILIVQRSIEFIVGVLFSTALFLAFPRAYFLSGQLATFENAFFGAVIIWTIFFVPFLYILVSSFVQTYCMSKGISRLWLSLIGSAIFLLESGLLMLGLSVTALPATFWIVWSGLGLTFFGINFLTLSFRSRHQDR